MDIAWLFQVITTITLISLSLYWFATRKSTTNVNKKEERKKKAEKKAEKNGAEQKRSERELEEREYFESFANNKIIEIRELPIISLCTDKEKYYMAELLADHFHEYGFVVLRLNDKDRKIISDMFKSLQIFMNNDIETKSKAKTDDITGYAYQKSMGFETFQFRYTDSKDFKWPEIPPNFEENAKKYYLLLHQIACFILELLALHLKCDPKFFAEMLDKFPFSDVNKCGASTLRLFRYFNETSKTTQDLTHIDIALLTLLPASATSGLQIYVESMYQWVAVEKSAQRGDLIIFPGSMIQIITNGYLKGTVHRVVRDGNSERYSMPLGFLPRMDSHLKVVDSPSVDPEFEHNTAMGFNLPLLVEEFVEDQYRKRAVRRALQVDQS